MKSYLYIFAITVIVGSFLVSWRLTTPANAQESIPASERTGLSSSTWGNRIEPGETAQSKVETDQIIIKYRILSQAHRQPSQADQMQRLSAAAGVSLTYQRPMSGDAHVLRLPGRLPEERVQRIVGRLMMLPEVEYAEPDQILQHTLTPNDLYYSYQWDYNAPAAGNYGINAPVAWDITTGSNSVVVAVVDTGYLDHADLAGRFVQGYDFINDSLVANDGNGRDSDAHDPGDWITAAENASGYFKGCGVSNSSWHGTHVAGTIGAKSNNSLGVTGINWNARILPVRVLGKCGGYDSDIADGVRWAAGLPVSGVPANANPAKVINLSLGGTGSCTTAWQDAINEVIGAGATMVVAAGNSNVDASGFFPANCNGVIAVAATDRNGSRSYYSNYGSTVEISAPGGAQYYTNDPNGILSTLNTGTQSPVADAYAYYQGTSMAAPHVTGIVSLLYSVNPSLTPAQVLSILQSTATAFPIGSTCNTFNCGSGIVNGGAAVRSLVIPTAFNKSSPDNEATGEPTNPTLYWDTSSRASSYEYCVNTSPYCPGSWTNVDSSTNASLSGLTNGVTYYWQARALNTIGTTDADSGAWWSFTIVPSPSITNFSPASGPVGTSVTMTGTNFTGATAVRFNGLDASFTVDSSTLIHATVPVGATTGKISVVTPNGTAASGSDFRIGTFVQFSSPTYTVLEADGPAAILVTLNASSTQVITVSYTTSDGTATAGVDYIAASGTLTFTPGTTTQTINLGIIDDTLDEVDETLSIKLSSPVNVGLGLPSEATLTIKDDDPVPSVSLEKSSYSVSEGGGTISMTVQLSAPSSKPITVSYSTSDGSASTGSDYIGASGSITFNHGMTDISIQIPILADGIHEENETFTLSLTNPINATLANPSIVTCTIIDDDLPPRYTFLPIIKR